MQADDFVDGEPLKAPIVEVTLRIRVDHSIPVPGLKVDHEDYRHFIGAAQSLLSNFENDLKTLEIRFESLLK